MKKRFLLLLLLLCGPVFWAQNETIESLKKQLKTVNDDQKRVMILKDLSYELSNYDPNMAFKYATQQIELSKKNGFDLGLGYGYRNLGLCYSMISNNVRALEYLDKADSTFVANHDMEGTFYSNLGIGNLFSRLGNYDEALEYFKKTLAITKSLGKPRLLSLTYDQMSMVYRRKGLYTEALFYAKKSLDIDIKYKTKNGIALSYTNLGIVYYYLKRFGESEEFLDKALFLLKGDKGFHMAFAESHRGIGLYEKAKEMPDNEAKRKCLLSAASHLKIGTAIFSSMQNLFYTRKNYKELYSIAKALHNEKFADECAYQAFTLGDKIMDNEKLEFAISLKGKHKARKHQLESDDKSKLITFGAAGIVAIILLLVFFVRKHSFEKKTNNLLADKKAEIEKLNTQKDQFYSIIAHDLRGSLGGFHALTEFLVEEGNSMDKDQIMESIVIMRDSANGLFGLLEGLLDWSKSENGLVEFNPQVIELSQTIGKTIGVLSETAYKKDIEIYAEVKEDLTVYADDNLLQTVLRNLISNAIKFTPKGGKVEVRTQIDGMQNVEIQISDTGIGMNAQMLKDLFNSEVKTNRLGTDNEPSTGLGMVLCKEFVERHGGKIWVESEVGEGTVFHFNIPSKQCVS